ncbi:hypothetical protein J2S58_002107 [Nakamurella flavida]|uniref:hypothetical protein n=1 Tax=Nakamurella flavida TaxID=363630 RepID=UPI0027832A7D|nr:hypothetical protein [Nakamurella flavida]MDP9778484.1 hypothetical protein [Nakamurella flavida]
MSGATGGLPPDGPAGVRRRYIVSAAPAVLTALIPDLSADPAVELLAVAGPAGRPRRLVARMADRTVRALRADTAVTVEPDDDLVPPAPAVPREARP